MNVSHELQTAVCEIVAEVLGTDVEEVRPESNFFHDLGGESIDVLDLGFHVEKRLRVRVHFHQMLTPDRWDFDEAGRLTSASVQRLKEEFPYVVLPTDCDSLDPKDIFTVEFIVETIQRAKTAPVTQE